MKKPMNKDLKAILLCGAATLMGIISIFTTDASIMRGFYGLLSIIFLVGVIISTKKYIENKKINEIDDEQIEE
ncbi:hypothetical protein [uncultured Clostridium sp.]|uniref:hypothetical protein n=1 Tax=uncultured Clostridium sp. TaxID=59620 RepID=UPI002729AF66|nr:hypothetical protein [uncultured Clostridium sp.]